MTDQHSSRTALGAATLRAAHQLIDDTPRILDDPIVAQLLDADVVTRIQRLPEQFRTARASAWRSLIVLRSRYAEDRLAQAVERGVSQYLILGAGLDTFAYRQPPWAHGLQIFEVDHPASQRDKQERLARAVIPLPANVEYVPIDFENEPLSDGLRRSGFDLDRPVFVSWLGVTVYLSEEAIDAVLRFVATLPESSEIVFSFASAKAASESTVAAWAAALGEPWRTHFEPDTLIEKLHDLGFSTALILPPAEAAVYFQDRHDGLVSRRPSIAYAIC